MTGIAWWWMAQNSDFCTAWGLKNKGWALYALHMQGQGMIEKCLSGGAFVYVCFAVHTVVHARTDVGVRFLLYKQFPDTSLCHRYWLHCRLSVKKEIWCISWMLYKKHLFLHVRGMEQRLFVAGFAKQSLEKAECVHSITRELLFTLSTPWCFKHSRQVLQVMIGSSMRYWDMLIEMFSAQHAKIKRLRLFVSWLCVAWPIVKWFRVLRRFLYATGMPNGATADFVLWKEKRKTRHLYSACDGGTVLAEQQCPPSYFALFFHHFLYVCWFACHCLGAARRMREVIYRHFDCETWWYN